MILDSRREIWRNALESDKHKVCIILLSSFCSFGYILTSLLPYSLIMAINIANGAANPRPFLLSTYLFYYLLAIRGTRVSFVLNDQSVIRLPFGKEAFSFIHIKMTENSESGRSHHWDLQMPIQPILVPVLSCILKVRYWTNLDWATIIMVGKGAHPKTDTVFYISHQRVIGPISNCCFKDSLK